MNRTGQPFGTAIRRLSASNEDPEESSIFRRFNALATATDITEIAQHLRGIIQLLRSNGIPLDYPKLSEDLYGLQSPATASRIRLRWGQEYYYTPPKEESDASAHPEKEKRDE